MIDFSISTWHLKPMERVHLVIRGRVQGVFFRANTEREGRRLGLCGWVKNTEDGGVKVVAEGPRAKLEELVEWCRHGPPHAMVQGIDIDWEKPQGLASGFRVVY